jgi:hypothetical protein
MYRSRMIEIQNDETMDCWHSTFCIPHYVFFSCIVCSCLFVFVCVCACFKKSLKSRAKSSRSRCYNCLLRKYKGCPLELSVSVSDSISLSIECCWSVSIRTLAVFMM